MWEKFHYDIMIKRWNNNILCSQQKRTRETKRKHHAHIAQIAFVLSICRCNSWEMLLCEAKGKRSSFPKTNKSILRPLCFCHTNKILRYYGWTGYLERVTKSNTVLEYEHPRIYDHDISTITNLWHQHFAHAFPAPVLFHQQTYLHQMLLLSMAEATSTGALKRDHNCVFQLPLQRPYVDLQNWNQNITCIYCIELTRKK